MYLDPSPLGARILAPLAAYYDDQSTVEVRMSRPAWVVVDRRGEGKSLLPADDLSLAAIESICRSLGNVNGLRFDEEAPSLSCVLPGGHRFEALTGPSVRSGLSLAIRCKHPFTPSWKQLGVAEVLQGYLQAMMLRSANVVISGATNTGKTTLLNRLLRLVPGSRRVVAVEDTPELDLSPFWDGVGLLAAREAGTGAGLVGWRQLYDHVMRITPDHIVFGEISTGNAFAALGALNSGVTGFLCTIHAESPQQALSRKFDQNIAWSGMAMPRVPEFLAELIDVVIQIQRDADGYRRITDIWEPRQDRWVLRDGLHLARPAEAAAGQERPIP